MRPHPQERLGSPRATERHGGGISWSPHERATRGVVRAVNLRMAVGATAGEQVRAGIRACRKRLRRTHEGGMSRARMAGLAEERWPQLEERWLYRAVRVVTVGAILRNGLMLPQKRSALFAVAGRAGFVSGVLYELHRRRRSMRRVARSARHLALAERMARQL